METVFNKVRKSAPKAALLMAVAAGAMLQGCSSTESSEAAALVSGVAGDAASKVYVAPGQHDELYTDRKSVV